MKWIEITVFTTQEGLEAVAARFDMLGIPQVVMEESRESIAAFLEENAKYWDYADLNVLVQGNEPCVRAYVADTEANAELVARVQTSFLELREEDLGIDLGSLRMAIGLRDEEDWENNWKLYYKPLMVGKRLLVCPSWETTDNPEGRVVLRLDPGMAFGTGTHHTTRMCLSYLEKTVQAGAAMLDLGCGSGILAIAAVLLGAKHATCVDIDPVAEKVARENALLNGIGEDRHCVYAGDILTDKALIARIREQRYQIITANIVASVIIPLAPLIPDLLAEDGVFICSGIITERLAEVQHALTSANLRILATRQAEDWCAIMTGK